VIGKAGFGYNFNSLALAQQAAPSSSNGNGQGMARDAVAVLDGLTTPAMLLTYKLPLPRWAVPGIRGYDEGIKELEQVVADMLQVTQRLMQGSSAVAIKAATTILELLCSCSMFSDLYR
jgi:hypothetical protein